MAWAHSTATRAPSLTIFFPMWNEELCIGEAVAVGHACGEMLIRDGTICSYELLLIDDASTDATGVIADAIALADPRVRVIHHVENIGLGGALRTGFEHAAGQLILDTDCDLPFDLAELRRAIPLVAEHGADIVSGFRHGRGGEGLRRSFYSFAYNRLIQSLFGLRVRDVNFALKLCRREVFDGVRLSSNGSFVDAELLIRARRNGLRITQIGVDYQPRTRGKSTLSSPLVMARIVRELNAFRRESMPV